MENASKALLIAGGVLVSILVITVFIYMITRISEFRRSNEDLARIENVSEFNKRFTNYQRDDVQGYELLSLIHNVIDYNEQYSTDSTINKDSYNPISLTICLKTVDNRDLRNQLTYDNNNRLFTLDTYKDEIKANNRNTSNSFQYSIEKKIEDAKNTLGIQGDDIASKLAKNINSIFKTKEQIQSEANKYNSEDAVYNLMANTYNQCTGNTGDNTMDIEKAKKSLVINTDSSGNYTNNNQYYNYANMLYEYMQFKRGQFKCTKLEYDENTERVKSITFNIVKIK